MTQTYNDPVKQLSREKQRDFIARHLAFKRPQDIKVVCFPGAEVEGEEALEIKEVYDPLGIPRENIVGIEGDEKKAERLRRADLGIKVVHAYDLDYFTNTDRQFDVISLDYTGYRDEDKWLTLHQLAGRQVIYGNGILCTNYQAARESKKVQAQFLTMHYDPTLSRLEREAKTEQLVDDFQKGKKVQLSDLRDALTERIQAIMRMGTSAITPLDLLTRHPDHKRNQAILQNVEDRYKDEEMVKFMRENRVRTMGGVPTPTNPLSYLYRKINIDSLREHMAKANNIVPELAKLFLDYLLDTEMKAMFPRAMERYSYQSNKRTPMEMDLIAFRSADWHYRLLKGKIMYNKDTAKLTVPLSPQKFKEIWYSIVQHDRHIFDIPEREYLGSSWKPAEPETITKEQAIDLLKEGITPAEIADCYAGFTKMQLAAFKAHITMGTY